MKIFDGKVRSMLVSLHYGRPRLTTIRHLYKTVNSSTAVENFFFHKKTLYVHFTPLQQHGCTLTGPLLKFIAAYMLKINMIFENYQEF